MKTLVFVRHRIEKCGINSKEFSSHKAAAEFVKKVENKNPELEYFIQLPQKRRKKKSKSLKSKYDENRRN